MGDTCSPVPFRGYPGVWSQWGPPSRICASIPPTHSGGCWQVRVLFPCGLFSFFWGSRQTLSPWPAAPPQPASSCCTQGPFVLADATKITLAPSSADINLGDNLTLQCHASHDPTMDLTFIWTLDDFPIDSDKPGGHYQRASMVRPEARELRASPSLVDRGPKMSLIITTPKPFPFPQECWQAHLWVHKHPPLDRQLPGFHPKSVHAGKG